VGIFACHIPKFAITAVQFQIISFCKYMTSISTTAVSSSWKYSTTETHILLLPLVLHGFVKNVTTGFTA
jgi:hypothetical protein